MKLIKSEYQGELYSEFERYHFIESYRIDIISDTNQKIGNITGHLVNMSRAQKDIQTGNGSNFFLELDEISQLCCNLAELIITNKSKFNGVERVYFLNNLNIQNEYLSMENEIKALKLLHSKAEVVVYSLGSTELDDEDFPERDEGYWENHEKMIRNLGWQYDETFNFFIIKDSTNWTADTIESKVNNVSVLEIKVKPSEKIFWLTLFSDPKAILGDQIYDNECYDIVHDLLSYHYAKSQLEKIEAMKLSTNLKITPLSLHFLLEYIEHFKEMRQGGGIEFVDPLVEENMDAVIEKYYKVFKNKSFSLKGEYDDLIEILFTNQTRQKINLLYKEVHEDVEEYRRSISQRLGLN